MLQNLVEEDCAVVGLLVKFSTGHVVLLESILYFGTGYIYYFVLLMLNVFKLFRSGARLV